MSNYTLKPIKSFLLHEVKPYLERYFYETNRYLKHGLYLKRKRGLKLALRSTNMTFDLVLNDYKITLYNGYKSFLEINTRINQHYRRKAKMRIIREFARLLKKNSFFVSHEVLFLTHRYQQYRNVNLSMLYKGLDTIYDTIKSGKQMLYLKKGQFFEFLLPFIKRFSFKSIRISRKYKKRQLHVRFYYFGIRLRFKRHYLIRQLKRELNIKKLYKEWKPPKNKQKRWGWWNRRELQQLKQRNMRRLHRMQRRILILRRFKRFKRRKERIIIRRFFRRRFKKKKNIRRGLKEMLQRPYNIKLPKRYRNKYKKKLTMYLRKKNNARKYIKKHSQLLRYKKIRRPLISIRNKKYIFGYYKIRTRQKFPRIKRYIRTQLIRKIKRTHSNGVQATKLKHKRFNKSLIYKIGHFKSVSIKRNRRSRRKAHKIYYRIIKHLKQINNIIEVNKRYIWYLIRCGISPLNKLFIVVSRMLKLNKHYRITLYKTKKMLENNERIFPTGKSSAQIRKYFRSDYALFIRRYIPRRRRFSRYWLFHQKQKLDILYNFALIPIRKYPHLAEVIKLLDKKGNIPTNRKRSTIIKNLTYKYAKTTF